MSIVLLGATSGSVTLAEPAVGGSTVIDIPAASGTMVVTGSSPSLANVTATGNLSVNGNTTLGDASTDTVLMTGAPSIGGAGLGMGMGFRNRIINGAMVIDQRNGGASVSNTAVDTYAVDRFVQDGSSAGKFTAQQTPSATETGYATRVSAGFRNYLAFTSSAATTVSSSNYYRFWQSIEGFNTADLAWGTANAKSVTLSFWVNSSLTGTFGGIVRNNSGDKTYPYSYTISSANTWEQKTITIAGDTSGTWSTTTGVGIQVMWSLGCGSTRQGTAGAWTGTAGVFTCTGETQIVATSGATFYITGVQFEKGSTATSFDYRDYGRELIMCQRYYVNYAGQNFAMNPSGNNGQNSNVVWNFSVPMRAAPTASNITGIVAAYTTAYTISSASLSTSSVAVTYLIATLSALPGYSSSLYLILTTCSMSAEL